MRERPQLFSMDIFKWRTQNCIQFANTIDAMSPSEGRSKSRLARANQETSQLVWPLETSYELLSMQKPFQCVTQAAAAAQSGTCCNLRPRLP